MKPIKKILIPTDFSAFSLTALDYVKNQPAMDDATLYILHVVNDPVLVAPYPNVDLNAETILRDSAARAEQELERFIEKHLADERSIIAVVRRGEASREINKFAEAEKIDLIVIATHGRTGLAHVLMGSVAEKVVRYSHVPVLTIKPEEVLELMAGHEHAAEMHVGVR
jgi:nucleotide-binding universal stress UspA family protein